MRRYGGEAEFFSSGEQKATVGFCSERCAWPAARFYAREMNFVRNLFATPAKTPPKIEADFYKHENGHWNAIGNEYASTTLDSLLVNCFFLFLSFRFL